MAKRSEAPASPDAAESKRPDTRMATPEELQALQKEVEAVKVHKAHGLEIESAAKAAADRLDAVMHSSSAAAEEPVAVATPKVGMFGKVRGFFGRMFAPSVEKQYDQNNAKILKEGLKQGRAGIKADATAVKAMAMPKDDFKKMMAEGKKLDRQGRTKAEAEKARIEAEEATAWAERSISAETSAKDLRMAFGKGTSEEKAKMKSQEKARKGMAELETAEARASLTNGLTGKAAKIALGQAMPDAATKTAGQKIVEKAVKRVDESIFNLEQKYGGLDKVANKIDVAEANEAEAKANRISLARRIAGFAANDLDQSFTDLRTATDKTLTGAAWMIDKSKIAAPLANATLNAIPKTLETVLNPHESLAKASKVIRNRMALRGQGKVVEVADEEESESPTESALSGFKKATEAAKSKPEEASGLEKMGLDYLKKMGFEYKMKSDDIRDMLENMDPPADAEELENTIRALNKKIAKNSGVSVEEMNAMHSYGIEKLGGAEVGGVKYVFLRSNNPYGRVDAITLDQAKRLGVDKAPKAKADRTPAEDAPWAEINTDSAPDEVTKVKVVKAPVDRTVADVNMADDDKGETDERARLDAILNQDAPIEVLNDEPVVGPEISKVVKAEAAKRKPAAIEATGVIPMREMDETGVVERGPRPTTETIRKEVTRLLRDYNQGVKDPSKAYKFEKALSEYKALAKGDVSGSLEESGWEPEDGAQVAREVEEALAKLKKPRSIG